MTFCLNSKIIKPEEEIKNAIILLHGYGGDGNDQIFGYIGPDDLFGGPKNDTLVGGSGSDVVHGGTGEDTLAILERGLLGDTDRFFGGDDGPTLPAPVAVYRVWSDGREEALRDAAFSSVNRWLLRDIVAAGAVHRQVWLAGVGQLGSGTTSGLPTMIEAPTVLVGEVEIVPSSADPRDAHGVPAP